MDYPTLQKSNMAPVRKKVEGGFRKTKRRKQFLTSPNNEAQKVPMRMYL